MLDFGQMTISSIEEVSGPRYGPNFLFPDIERQTLTENAGWMAPDLYDPERDLLAMVRQTFVIRTGEHTVLIDTCVGDAKPRNVAGFNSLHTPWERNFRSLGLSFEQIDYVFITHLHVDHVGWNTRLSDGCWVPSFPNARYYFPRTEFEYWAREYHEGRDSPDGSVFEDSVAPVVEAGKAIIVDDDSCLPEGFQFESAPGHSIGHCMIRYNTRDACLVFCGDVFHHPIQVRDPELASRFCEDKDRSRATRRQFLESCADQDVIVIPSHFERGSAGRVISTSEGYHFEFLSGSSTRL